MKINFNKLFLIILSIYLFASYFIIFKVESKFTGILNGDLGVIELIQNIVLILIIFVSLKFRKKLVSKYTKIVFYIKTIIFLVFLYEENSFLTEGLFDFIKNHNYQNELNIHNLNFMLYPIFNNFPILKNLIFIDDITVYRVSIFAIFFITGFGQFVFKKFEYLFIEKFLSPFFLTYPIFLYFSHGQYKANRIDLISLKLGFEMFELFIYLIFFFDTITKIYNIYKNKKIKNLLF